MICRHVLASTQIVNTMHVFRTQITHTTNSSLNIVYTLTFPPPPPPLAGSTIFPCHDKYFSQDMPTGCTHVYTHMHLHSIQGPETSLFWLQMVKKSGERTNPSQV